MKTNPARSALTRGYRLLVLFSVFCVLASGCSFSKKPATPPPQSDASGNTSSIEGKGLVETTAPLADTPWILMEFASAHLNPLLDVRLVTIHFDINGSSVSGTSACNDYFAVYEANDINLAIRELGTLMMTCDETAMKVEEAFFDSLAEARGYQILGETLTLTNESGKMLLRFKVAPYAKSVAFTREELANATYPSEFVEGGRAALLNSEYRSILKDSAEQLIIQLTYHMAFGDLDGDEIEEAAVVFVTNSGGSGIFYDLAVVKKTEAGLINAAITRLGDRILVKDITIEQRVIIVDMLVASSGHITCCPDAPVERRYQLSDSELILEQ